MFVQNHVYQKEAVPELVCAFSTSQRVTVYTVSPRQEYWTVMAEGINYAWRIDFGTQGREYFNFFRINGVNSPDMALLTQLRARFSKGAIQSSTVQGGGAYSEVIYSVCEYVVQ